MEIKYIAKNYKIIPQKTAFTDEAQIDVVYELMGIGDAHGTRSPAAEKEYRVSFSLKKQGTHWNILMIIIHNLQLFLQR